MPEAETLSSTESTGQASVEEDFPRGFPSDYAGMSRHGTPKTHIRRSSNALQWNGDTEIRSRACLDSLMFRYANRTLFSLRPIWLVVH